MSTARVVFLDSISVFFINEGYGMEPEQLITSLNLQWV